MAYQLASYTQAGVASAGRGRILAREVQTRVGKAMEETVGLMEDVGEHGLELAPHATGARRTPETKQENRPNG